MSYCRFPPPPPKKIQNQKNLESFSWTEPLPASSAYSFSFLVNYLSTYKYLLTAPCLSLIMLSLARRGTRWGKLSNYHPLLNYAALISWLGSSGTVSVRIEMVIFSSEQHLFHSFRATTTKINNVWIMSQKERCCIHPSLCHLHVRSKEPASMCCNLCRTTEAEISFTI